MRKKIRNPKLVKILSELENEALKVSAIIQTAKDASEFNDNINIEIVLNIAAQYQNQIIEKISDLY